MLKKKKKEKRSTNSKRNHQFTRKVGFTVMRNKTHERGHTLDWVMFKPEDNVLCGTSVTQSVVSA